MTKTFPNFDELVTKLALRGVGVVVTGRYSFAKDRMNYKAEVSTDKFTSSLTSWPSVQFTVYGRCLGELAEDINARLPLVEPVIAALEKHREHREAVRKAVALGDELADIVHGENRTSVELRHPPVESVAEDNGVTMEPTTAEYNIAPNCDPKTMREKPIVIVDTNKPPKRIFISSSFAERMFAYKAAIETGVMSPAEVRQAEGLPPLT